MLPKQRRIERKLFPQIISTGKRFNSTHLLLYKVTLEASTPSKFSFSVSKKVCKHAVDRNKHRRRAYSIVSKCIKQAKPSFLCFFSFKKDACSITYKDLEKEIVFLLGSASVI